MINKSNLLAYLKFLETKINKTFDEKSLQAWGNIPDSDVNMRLQKMYSNLEWDSAFVSNTENEFLSSLSKVTQSINIAPSILPKSQIEVNPVSNIEAIESIPFTEVHDAEVIEAPKIPVATVNEIAAKYTNNNLEKEGPAINANTSPLQNAPNEDSYYPLPETKKKSIVGKVFGVLGLLALGCAGYTGYKYYQFLSLPYAYSLADNLAIHKSNDEVSEVINRMDLFSAALKPNGEIQSTLNGLKVIGRSGDYTKVLLDPSFQNYLFGKSTAIGYINKKYTTEDESEYEKYLNIFSAFKSDYNEMDKLQFNYRKLIYTAFKDFVDFKNTRIAAPCFSETKLSDKAALSIGTIKEMDALKNIKNIYASIQLNNGQYYTIKGNKDGTLVEKVWPIVIKTLAVKPKNNDTLSIGPIDIDVSPITDLFDTGKPEEKTNLTVKGKFKVSAGNPQELSFNACDNSLVARTRYAPYNILVKY